MLRRYIFKAIGKFQAVEQLSRARATPAFAQRARYHSESKVTDLNEVKPVLPKRHQAFIGPVKSRPAMLNIKESTTQIHRLMSISELDSIIASGVVGHKGLLHLEATKRAHLHLPEHIQENNTKLLLSFSHDPMSAAAYAGVQILPAFYALVTTNLPPVYTLPAKHALLDQGPFDLYHHFYKAKERQIAMESGSPYRMPINPSELCQVQKEVDLVINTIDGSCDFRPQADTMIRRIHFLRGAFREYTFVSTPQPIAHQAKHSDWAIEVLCPISDDNYYTMLKTARDQNLIPPHSRLLTVDDAATIFPELTHLFPAATHHLSDHVHILKYVPEECPIRSPQAVEFLVKEHSIFRQKHPQPNQNHPPLLVDEPLKRAYAGIRGPKIV